MKNEKKWTFVTNHAMVLNCIANNPRINAWEIALAIGIQERAVRRIIADLIEAGYIESRKEGRRNHYIMQEHLPLRRPSHSATEVGDLLRTLDPKRHRAPSGRTKRSV